MHRIASRDKRFKKAIWTKNQKLQVVSTYLMLGSMTQTAIVTGIPYDTIRGWKPLQWWKDYALQLQAEDVQQLDSNLRRIVDKSLKSLEDRIDLGDAQFDQKTGKIKRIPIKAHVALKISSELMNQRKAASKQPVKEEMQSTINDRLLKLAEEFAKFTTSH